MVPESVPISEVLLGGVAEDFRDLGFGKGNVATIVGRVVLVVLV